MAKVKPRAKMGRPVEPVPADTADAIIAWLEVGKTLREFCAQPGAPAWRTVYHWAEKDEDFAARFARARDVGSDAIAEESLAIIDAPPAMAVGADGSAKTDAAWVAYQRNRAELRLKLLAKWNPKRYGDRLDVTSKGDKVQSGLTIVVDLSKGAAA